MAKELSTYSTVIPGGAMLRNRKGVTLIEIMTAVGLAIVMTAIAFPKLKETRRAANMESAKTQVQSYLSVARSVAVRNGVRSFLIRDGNTMRILADSGTGLAVVVRPMHMDSISNVLLTSSSERAADTIVYDNRGMAVNLAGTQKFYITTRSGVGAGVKDSICVTRLGLVLDRNCGLVVMPEKKDEEIILDPDIIIIDPKEGPISLPPPIVVDK
jgi:Tfp pilus assembly protein FimT